MPDTKPLEPEVLEILTGKMNLRIPSPDLDLVDGGFLDSLTFIDLLTHLESRFGIHISVETLEVDDFRTVEKIAKFVAAQGGK